MTDKPLLFDLEKFIEEFCLLRVGENGEFTIFDLERIEGRDFATKVMNFIKSECLRNRIEGARDAENILRKIYGKIPKGVTYGSKWYNIMVLIADYFGFNPTKKKLDDKIAAELARMEKVENKK